MVHILKKPFQLFSMNNTRSINLQALLAASYKLFRDHIQFLLGLVATLMVLAVVPGIYYDLHFSGIKDFENLDLSTLLFNDREVSLKQRMIAIALQLLEWIVELGVLAVFLKLVDSSETSVGDIFKNWDKVFAYVVGTVLFGIVVVIGLILLIIPGIYFGLRLQFYAYLIIDKGLSPFEALSESYNLTRGFTFDLLILAFIQIFVGIFGLLFFIIGIIPAIGYLYVVNAMVYRSLIEEDGPIPAIRFREPAATDNDYPY